MVCSKPQSGQERSEKFAMDHKSSDDDTKSAFGLLLHTEINIYGVPAPDFNRDMDEYTEVCAGRPCSSNSYGGGMNRPVLRGGLMSGFKKGAESMDKITADEMYNSYSAMTKSLASEFPGVHELAKQHLPRKQGACELKAKVRTPRIVAMVELMWP